MTQTLVVPYMLFRHMLRHLRQAPQAVGWYRAGRSRMGDDTRWLMRYALREQPRIRQVTAVSAPIWHCRLLTQSATIESELVVPGAPGVVGSLLIGDGLLRGFLWGAVRTEQGEVPLDSLCLVGPGMNQLPLAQPQASMAGADTLPLLPVYDGPLSLEPATVWSRTIGALGGEAVWHRLVGLRVVVVGVGRTGSVVATMLARLGLRHLTLIDPDHLEAHNLGEMPGVPLHASAVGRPKVEALADALYTSTRLECTVLPVSIATDTARDACKQADVLVCCVDNDTARLATAIFAALYYKVLLDMGSGIFLHGSNGQEAPSRTMGADVRLVLPGDGCLLCRGQLANFVQAVEALGRPLSLEAPQEWRQQRAGSLTAINQLAAAVGLQMLQDLVAARIQASLWAHLSFDEAGRLSVQYPTTLSAPHEAACTLCARAGLGDAGLWWG